MSLTTVQEDDSIPIRGKKGVKSKKQVRDEVSEMASTDSVLVELTDTRFKPIRLQNSRICR
jgi:hypothetical protein